MNRGLQTALRAQRLAIETHQTTIFESRWPAALTLVARSSLWGVSRREEAAPRRDLPPFLPPRRCPERGPTGWQLRHEGIAVAAVGGVEGASGRRVVGGGSVPRNGSTARSVNRDIVADITISPQERWTSRALRRSPPLRARGSVLMNTTLRTRPRCDVGGPRACRRGFRSRRTAGFRSVPLWRRGSVRLRSGGCFAYGG